MEQAIRMIKALDGCKSIRLIKRTHYIKEMDNIRDELPPDAIIVLAVNSSEFTAFSMTDNLVAAITLLQYRNSLSYFFS